jgi:hypothetical protein
VDISAAKIIATGGAAALVALGLPGLAHALGSPAPTVAPPAAPPVSAPKTPVAPAAPAVTAPGTRAPSVSAPAAAPPSAPSAPKAPAPGTPTAPSAPKAPTPGTPTAPSASNAPASRTPTAPSASNAPAPRTPTAPSAPVSPVTGAVSPVTGAVGRVSSGRVSSVANSVGALAEKGTTAVTGIVHRVAAGQDPTSAARDAVTTLTGTPSSSGLLGTVTDTVTGAASNVGLVAPRGLPTVALPGQPQARSPQPQGPTQTSRHRDASGAGSLSGPTTGAALPGDVRKAFLVALEQGAVSVSESVVRSVALLATSWSVPAWSWSGGLVPLAPAQATRETSAPDGAAPSPVPAPKLPGPGASGLPGGVGTGILSLLLASLLSTFALAVPRLGRWLRPTPDAVRLQYIAPIELPG